MEGTVRSRSLDSGFKEPNVSSFSAMFSMADICGDRGEGGQGDGLVLCLETAAECSSRTARPTCKAKKLLF